MKILCLGDSLTAGYGVEPHQCWVSLTEKLTGFHLMNAGSNGQRTSPMRHKLPRLLETGPDAMILMGGINDLIFDGTDRGPQALENIRSMLHMARQASVQPILGLAPGICADRLWPEWRACFDPAALRPAYQSLRQSIRGLACEMRLPVIDFEAALHRASGCPDLEDLLYDGLHPNFKGHGAMAHAAAQALSALFFDAQTTSLVFCDQTGRFGIH